MSSNEDLKKILEDISDIKDIKGVFVPTNDTTTLMQYTGRLDENGVEIYEGDILQVKDVYDGTEFHGVVRYRDCSFIIKNDYCSYYRWMDYECRVVGNIFENPDILEDLDIVEKINKRSEEDNGKRYTLEEIREIFLGDGEING